MQYSDNKLINIYLDKYVVMIQKNKNDVEALSKIVDSIYIEGLNDGKKCNNK